MKPTRNVQTALPGQGGLVAIAVTIMIALVIAGAALTGLSKMNSTRTVVMRQSLQTYYVAQAGIQEALATRMMPRSNYLSFTSLNPQTALYPNSGEVFETPGDATTKIGVYRYVIVGGDPALESDGDYYSDANTNSAGTLRILSTETIPDDSPFYIISNGMSCKSDSKAIGRGAQAPSTAINPTCPAGFTLDEVTLVSEARLEREDGSNDSIDRQWVFRDRTAIELPGEAFVPGTGGGWTDTVNFDNAWAATTATNTPADPSYVVFYDFIDGSIIASEPITGGTTSVATAIPASAVIRLYFTGAVDYRSIYKYDLPTCISDADECNVQVVSNPGTGSEQVFSGNTIIPVLPSGTQVILLPPLDNTTPGGSPHEIRITGGNTGVKSYSNAPMSRNLFTIEFTTAP